MKRIVVVSIIGIDRFSAGYLAAKVAHERALRAGPIPVRILRAAQFHEFVGQLVDWGRQGDGLRAEDAHAARGRRTVAEALVGLAEAPGSADVPTREIAGPEVEDLVAAATRLVARRGDPLRIEGVTNPADPDAHLYETGALLPGPDAILAGPSFDQWLESADGSSGARGTV